jgi:hypothetical protein
MDRGNGRNCIEQSPVVCKDREAKGRMVINAASRYVAIGINRTLVQNTGDARN